MMYTNTELQSAPIFSPWVQMPRENWACITKRLDPQFYRKQQVIYHQEAEHQNVYLVHSGRVCLDIVGYHGHTHSLFIAAEGAFFGELAPLDLLPNFCSATCVSDAWIYTIPKAHFLELLETNAIFTLNLVRMLSQKLRTISNQVRLLALHNSQFRVCYALINLMEQFGREEAGGCTLGLKFTHQEMANLTGLSRVSVSNVFLELMAKGIIEKQGGYLVIKDVAQLYGCILQE